MDAREVMKSNVRAHNKFMDADTLNGMGVSELLANCHPSDRSHLLTLYEDENKQASEHRRISRSR